MNTQKLSKASLSNLLRKNGVEVVTPRNSHVNGVELNAWPTMSWPCIEIDMQTRAPESSPQTNVEARGMLAVKVVKILAEAGIQCYMVEKPNDAPYRELVQISVAMTDQEPSKTGRLVKVWPESIENLMVKRISKRAAEERAWRQKEAEEKAAREAERNAEIARRQAAFWNANGKTIEPFATVLGTPTHKVLIYKLRGAKRDMVLLCDCRQQKNWLDESLEWNVSVGHLDIMDDDARHEGVGSTSTRGATIAEAVVELCIAWGGW